MTLNQDKVRIIDLLHDARGIGISIENENSPKIFVDQLLPNEEAHVEIIRNKKNYLEGNLVEITKKSPYREVPLCPYFGLCGGCHLQHCSFIKENEYKKNKITKSIQKIANIKDIPEIPFIAEQEYEYRNRIRLHVEYNENKYNIGFHKKNSNEIISIDNCPIFKVNISSILKDIKDLLIEKYQKENTLKEISLFYSEVSKTMSINFKTNTHNVYQLPEIAKILTKKHPNISSVYHNKEKSNKLTTLLGKPYIDEIISSSSIKYSPLSFFQSNHQITELIYDKIIDSINEKDHILELYCGVGALSIPLAKKGEKITSIEINRNSHILSKINKEKNNIHNINFILKDVNQFNSNEKYDTLIVDPPRNGLTKNVINFIKEKKIPTLIYLSCNQDTFARDIKNIKDTYHLESVTGFNMFPKTYHLELMSILRIN